MSNDARYVTREDLAYAERVATLEVMAADFKEFSKSAEKRYERHQRFSIRLIVGVLLVVAAAFFTAALNTFEVSTSLANLTVKVGNIERDVAGLKTDVAGLKTDVAFLKENAVLKSDTAFIKQQVYEVLDETGLLRLVETAPQTHEGSLEE